MGHKCIVDRCTNATPSWRYLICPRCWNVLGPEKAKRVVNAELARRRSKAV